MSQERIERRREQARIRAARWRSKHPERATEVWRKYAAAHPFSTWAPEKKAAAVSRATAWAKANPGRVRELHRRRPRNPEASAERARRYEAKRSPEARAAKWQRWAQKNKARLAAYQRARSAEQAEQQRRRTLLIAKATPAWADLEAMRAVYREASRLTRETRVSHHVDHVIPLRGKGVCGLHVAANLQILTATANLKKGTRFVAT